MTDAPATRTSPPWHLWVVGVLSLLWNAFGVHSYNSTRKMLEHDLEDIRTEAERRGAQTGGAHRAS